MARYEFRCEEDHQIFTRSLDPNGDESLQRQPCDGCTCADGGRRLYGPVAIHMPYSGGYDRASGQYFENKFDRNEWMAETETGFK